MHRRQISSPAAPEAIGPYSQAVQVGDLVFCSGQIAIDPRTGSLLRDEDIAVQTRQVLENLQAVLQAAGARMDDVVKTTVFLADMEEFHVMNEVYAQYFSHVPPARATVEVARLPKDVKVEIDAIARVPG